MAPIYESVITTALTDTARVVGEGSHSFTCYLLTNGMNHELTPDWL